MNMQELIKLSQEKAKNRTPEERLALLQRANILDENGVYKAEFFSKETVEASKKARLSRLNQAQIS